MKFKCTMITKPELLWESKNKRWQIYLDNGKFTIDEVIPGYVFYPFRDSNGKTTFPPMSDIPKYVKERYERIMRK
ncbi:hypothetical protein KAU33_03900 [Candidatus Dependentiae bacterium]|nr:hypothetical protein [Candidatus Dependentiae bacterium]